mmetsp:Transcript_110036/g.245963  ORF Transcript_110036/g.245963 Transcript_110036/m.245963 type:complete len:231 (+) Transcript_110036:168-860(+)
MRCWRSVCQFVRFCVSWVVISGLRPDMAPQMLSTGPGTERRHPRTMIFPKRGWQGKAARWRPKGVRPSAAMSSRAPKSCKAARAKSTDDASGGSGVLEKKSALSVTPQAQSWRYMFSRGTRIISGSVRGSSPSVLPWVRSRKHTPGCTRPARPRRCFNESRAHHCSFNDGVLLNLSMPVRLSRQESMTMVTSGTVTEVSATFVQAMIFQVFPSGNVVLKASCCSSAPNAP